MKKENESVKLYPGFFSACLQLSIRGLKVLDYILAKVQPGKDKFFFLQQECMRYTGYKSKKTIYDGLTELLYSGIIARGRTDTVYFINPFTLFKGDRVAFMKKYVNRQSCLKN